MKRFEWIDTLKGIGICTVVAGHIYGGAIKEIIFIFHMPLFFCIGGFLYSSKYNNREYLKKKLIHLIVPYISFVILLYPIQLITALPQKDNFSFVDILKLIINPIVGGYHLWGLTSAFWFVTCFFITQQLANLIIKKANPNHLKFYIIFLIALSYLNSLVFPKFWLPQNAHIALAAIPLFLLGFLFRKYYRERNYYLISIPSVIISWWLIFFYSRQFPNQFFSVDYDMKGANYGIPIISLLLALGMIIFCIDVSKLLVERVPLVAKIFTALGKASMIILFLHIVFRDFLRFLNLGVFSSNFIVFILGTTLSFISYIIIIRFSLTRAILLGSEKDFDEFFITNHKQKL
ncbi:acyltransferase family protein [Okeania sp.]|uniref:acyltransferase family protein n=1 Tax=Okeania sp. TaxID=3100323 RepID=UPI002B4B3F5D|nr:acyltransferase family protein [Okeania sp.]MEB3341283.1 acyltransferase family protein [Okeania sp.]